MKIKAWKIIMNRYVLVIIVSAFMVGCVNKPVKPDRPYYAPVAPQQLQQPRPVNGSIFNAATNIDIYSDGRAHRVGDIITIVLSEKTQSSKSAKTTADKSSTLSLPQPTILGNALSVFGAPVSASSGASTNEFEGEGKCITPNWYFKNELCNQEAIAFVQNTNEIINMKVVVMDRIIAESNTSIKGEYPIKVIDSMLSNSTPVTILASTLVTLESLYNSCERSST
jgi:hypothetical protein